jgi:hypothetical protein
LSINEPGVNEWSPTEIDCGDVNDTTSGYCGWGGVGQVLYFEHHLAGGVHRDSLTVRKGQNLVVIQHSVEVFDPNGIDWAIANNPVVVLVLLLITSLPDN